MSDQEQNGKLARSLGRIFGRVPGGVVPAISMKVLRSMTTAAWAFGYAFMVVHSTGCGTDAVGVDECRDIESARCEAGAFCGLVDDVGQCKRFYRDQCLHGLANGDRPGSPQVKACIATIRAAGQCAKDGAEDVSSCTALPSQTIHAKVCDVILRPEGAVDCDFLGAPVEIPDASPDVAADAAVGADAASGDAGSD